MDADGNPTCPADVYRRALRRTPEVWRSLRRPAAICLAGDIAASCGTEPGFVPHHTPRRRLCLHEAGHLLIAYLVRGTPSAIAVFRDAGGICGQFDSVSEARGIWTSAKSDTEQNRDTVAAAPDRVDRLARAIERLFRRRWHRAALHALADRLDTTDFVSATEAELFFEGWFPRSPARVRAMARAKERIA